MSGEFTTRFVALGDSFTEGVGDPDPARPNGVRGWADRVAEQLQRADPHAGYANLAIRGRKVRAILAEQVEPALALRPTIVTLYAGANDILRPKVDIDGLLVQYDEAVARLVDSGAKVLLFTGFDAGSSKVFGAMRGRTAIYNEQVRWIADRHGATIVDYWRFHEFQDWRMWDVDRMHMSSLGHATMANRVLGVLEHEGVAEVPDVPPLPVLSRVEQARANALWVREFAGPWVMRRLTGRSSGDGLSPKYPELVRL
ncbi:SGNH hydrolase [Sinomonas cellulolyticus]|uniref:SGNH/GDSL hydrolase family protein n=1 Tax=Sinomonas cellulolyticus TaxID=2801916 RepID=UPI0019BBFCE4|nr:MULTISPECIES: SGNH/GDSL hydrolase family protein [Sinomonas]GHG50891.1 SGNH hydrolase [Sinomonas sp. KCTC 49339]